MTQQLTLFDAPPPPKLARSSDPQTSHESAAKTYEQLGDCHLTVLSVMGKVGYEWTARQIGQCAFSDNRSHEPDTYRKRMKELIRDGWIEVCGTTKDETTGRTVQIYRRVK